MGVDKRNHPFAPGLPPGQRAQTTFCGVHPDIDSRGIEAPTAQCSLCAPPHDQHFALKDLLMRSGNILWQSLAWSCATCCSASSGTCGFRFWVWGLQSREVGASVL